MEDISLHILDIAENSVEAGAKNITILVRENLSADLLTIVITDDGRGIDPAVARDVADPFFTTRTTRRVGLGLALLEEAAKMANGRLEINSFPTTGTKVTVTFQLSHIDRKPLGKIPETITAILSRCPDIDIVYTHEKNSNKFIFRAVDVREQLDGIPINSADTLNFIRRYLVQEENNLLD